MQYEYNIQYGDYLKYIEMHLVSGPMADSAHCSSKRSEFSSQHSHQAAHDPLTPASEGLKPSSDLHVYLHYIEKYINESLKIKKIQKDMCGLYGNMSFLSQTIDCL